VRTHAHPAAPRRGTTLLELVLVCAVVALLAAVALPRTRRLVDQIEVRGAADELRALCAAARQLAVLRGQPVTLIVDATAGTATVIATPDTITQRRVAAAFGVRLHASRDAITYAPTGLGYGVSNLSIVITRGAATDTLFVSRLGRVR
jgi:Tfp pilus assembly protein FimT